MRLTIPVLLFFILASSCNRYQYLAINSTQVQKNEQQGFTIENDTLEIVYNFNGKNAPVNLLVRNKLNKPIYIDWKRSALIVNGKAICYSPDEVAVRGVVNGGITRWVESFASTQASVNMTAKLAPGTQMIPPHSFVTKTPMGVTNKLLNNFPDSAFRKIGLILEDGSKASARQAFFGAENSPLQFRSYLAVVVGDSSVPMPVAYQHSFYVSELYRTGVRPKKFILYRDKPGEWSYVEEVTGFGKSAATGFGVLAGAAILTTDAWLESRNHQSGQK